MYAADEFYGDEVTTERVEMFRVQPPFRGTADTTDECVWCEDWAMGMDPEPCAHHWKGGTDA